MGPGIERSAVVITEFPYSNLIKTEMRPAVVLARANRTDWVLGQLTRNSTRDRLAIRLTDDDLVEGALLYVSYFRPAKLFTSHESLVDRKVGRLKPEVFNRLLDATMDNLDQNRMRE